MTLIVATTTPDGVWMAGDRVVGGFDYHVMKQPKIRRLDDDNDFSALLGAAGSSRVAQAIWRLELPPREVDYIHDWMTRLCDTIHDRARDLGLMRDPGNDDEPFLAGGTDIVVAAQGRVFLINDHLGWTEPAEGWVAIGGASETFAGAFDAYQSHLTRLEALRHAWTVTRRHHRIGELADLVKL